MQRVDALVEQRRSAGRLARLAHAGLDAHQVLDVQVFAVLHVGRNQERAVRQALREGALGAGEQFLVVGAVDQLAHVAARRALLAGEAAGHEGVQRRVRFGAVELDLGVGQRPGLAQLVGVDFEPPAEVQRLKGHERAEHVAAAADHAVVLEQHRVVPLFKLQRDVAAELFAAGQVVLRHAHLAADQRRVGQQADVWDLARQREGHQRRRVCVDDAPEIRAHPIDLAVEGQLH